MSQCSAIVKSTGKPCTFKALSGTQYCGKHTPKNTSLITHQNILTQDTNHKNDDHNDTSDNPKIQNPTKLLQIGLKHKHSKDIDKTKKETQQKKDTIQTDEQECQKQSKVVVHHVENVDTDTNNNHDVTFEPNIVKSVNQHILNEMADDLKITKHERIFSKSDLVSGVICNELFDALHSLLTTNGNS